MKVERGELAEGVAAKAQLSAAATLVVRITLPSGMAVVTAAKSKGVGFA